MLHRLFDGQRLLHFVPRAVAAAGWPRWIERHFGFDVVEGLGVGALGGHLWGRRLTCRGCLGFWQAGSLPHGSGRRGHDGRIIADGPTNAALHQVLKSRIAPGPLVVAPCGVEHAALAVRADPGPRLLALAFLAKFEDRAVL